MTKKDGDVVLVRPDHSAPETLSAGASYPVVVSTLGTQPSVYAFWEKRSDDSYSIEGMKVQ